MVSDTARGDETRATEMSMVGVNGRGSLTYVQYGRYEQLPTTHDRTTISVLMGGRLGTKYEQGMRPERAK